MKYLIKIWIYPLVIAGILLLFVNSCKKDVDLTIKDGDGNIYTTVRIGTQVWLRENLKTTKYFDGVNIPKVTNDTDWEGLSTPGYCWYLNDSLNLKYSYGALYNWYSVNSGKLCPAGWHIPADAEWSTLTTWLGGEDIAGSKLKDTGRIWRGCYPIPGMIDFTGIEPSGNKATNEAGFTALQGGYRQGGFAQGGFSTSFGYSGWWWSSTELYPTESWFRNLNYDRSDVIRSAFYKQNGYSVRCLQDY